LTIVDHRINGKEPGMHSFLSCLLSALLLMSCTLSVSAQIPGEETPPEPAPEAGPEEEPANDPTAEPEEPAATEPVSVEALQTAFDALKAESDALGEMINKRQQLMQLIMQLPPEQRAQNLIADFQKLSMELQARHPKLIETFQALTPRMDEGLKQAPDDLAMLDMYVEFYVWAQETRKAVPACKKLAGLKVEDLETQILLGNLYLMTNQYSLAITQFTHVLENMEPAHGPVLVGRGQARFAIHEFDKSLADYEAAKAVEGDYALSDGGREQVEQINIPSAKEYTGFWVKEQEIRKAEAGADDLPRVKLTTSKGEILVELFENEVPNTVASFIALTEAKFFDGTAFHRVISNFMIQGGDQNSKDDDPANDGQGSPGYSFADEFSEKDRMHFRGTLSMANSGPDTNGSQFFITHLPTEHLNKREENGQVFGHVVFGRVLEGQDVVDAIEQGDVLIKAEVTRKRDHEYVPDVVLNEGPPQPQDPEQNDAPDDDAPDDEPGDDTPAKEFGE
jgi:cyclophilin family peptidyl-prolyl cis-trans isomerase